MPNLEICGRRIGTFDSWDQDDTFVFVYYDVRPLEQYKGPIAPNGSITFDFEEGYAQSWSIDGVLLAQVDLIDAICGCPRVRPEAR